MLAEGGVNDANVEEDLGRIGDLLKLLQGFVELIIIVPSECRDPSLNFLKETTTQVSFHK